MRSRTQALLWVSIALLGSPAFAASPVDAKVARGSYLANGVGRCFWCHSPLTDADPATPRPGQLGAGDVLEPQAPIVAPNLTPDPATGLAEWSEREIVRAIREGIGRDGRRLSSVHPSNYYSVMTDEDASAVVAYLRSLPPIRHELPRSAPARPDHASVQPAVAPASSSGNSQLSRGAYLAQLGECRGCHTAPKGDGSPTRLDFGGGRRFFVEHGIGNEILPDPTFATSETAKHPHIVASANLTQDPSGIAFYDEAVFIQALRTGRVGGVRQLSAAMPWAYLGRMTDDDLRAVFAYLRSVAPVRHRVNNTDPPTPCPLCGRRHGLGELNAATKEPSR